MTIVSVNSSSIVVALQYSVADINFFIFSPVLSNASSIWKNGLIVIIEIYSPGLYLTSPVSESTSAGDIVTGSNPLSIHAWSIMKVLPLPTSTPSPNIILGITFSVKIAVWASYSKSKPKGVNIINTKVITTFVIIFPPPFSLSVRTSGLIK